MLEWVRMTPLGVPDVPEVYVIAKVVDGVGGIRGCGF